MDADITSTIYGNDGFDVMDTANPNYSEELEDITERETFQYKFRKRLESPRPINTPKNYLQRLATNSKKLCKFKGENGFIDLAKYSGSNCRSERQKLIDEKLYMRVARDINEKIDQDLKEIASQIKIKSSAMDKANYAAQKICDIGIHAGIGDLEITLYPLKNKNHNGLIINDFFIPSQKVLAANTIPSAEHKRNMKRELKEDEKVTGHCHSHGKYNNHFSEEDNKNIPLFKHRGTKINVNERTYKVFPAIVINKNNDEPATRVLVRKPHYFVEDGEIRFKYQFLDLNRTPGKDKYPAQRWPKLQIYDDNKKVDYKAIDEAILNKCFYNGKPLGDYFKKDTTSRNPVTNIIEHLKKSAPKKKSKTPAPKKESIEDRLEDKKERTQEDIGNKLNQWEKDYKILEKKYKNLKNDYDKLQNDYNNLRGNYLQLHANKNTYRQNLQNFYEANRDSMPGLVSKILMGEYRGTNSDIANGTLKEDKSNSRLWSWRKRLKALEDLGSLYSNSLSNEDKQYLKKICENNNYLKRKYPFRISEVTKLIDKF